ncbi:MAG: copper resistance protein CopC/CopD [Actinobacteria bacterium]|nr:copper resistance protein CopC/CopD [Actinomycetota bacterium]
MTAKHFVVAATIVAAVIALTAGPAFAHAVLISTDPAAGTTLTKAPKTVTLQFGENVEASLGAIRVFNSSAQRLDVSAPYHPNGRGSEVSANLPSLRSGLYVVTWRVISADSHPVHGAFTFQIGAATAPASTQSTNNLVASLLTKQKGSTTVGVVYGAVRAVVFAGLAVLIGGLVFVGVIWPEGRTSRRAARIVWAGWWVALISTLLAYAVQGIYAAGLPLKSIFDSAELRGVWHTRFGHISALRVALLVPTFGLLWWLFPGRRRPRALAPWWYGAGALTAVALALTPGLAGHASTGRWHQWALVSDVVHVGSMAVWLGGLLVLCACVMTVADPDLLRRVLPRFSTVALTCVGLLVATGVVQGYRQVGTLHALTSTTYGRLLLVKVAVVIVLVAAAGFSRDVVNRWFRYPLEPDNDEDVPEPAMAGVAAQRGGGGGGNGSPPDAGNGSPPDAGTGSAALAGLDPDELADLLEDERSEVRRLRRSVLAEVVVAAAVLVATSLLVNAPPPVALASQPFFKTVTAGDHFYDLIVTPAKTGPNQVHVTTVTQGGALANVLQMTITFDNPGKDIAPINVSLLRLAPGHYASYSFQFPFPGSWRMNVTARFSDIDETTFSAPVPIH